MLEKNELMLKMFDNAILYATVISDQNVMHLNNTQRSCEFRVTTYSQRKSVRIEQRA